MVKNSVLKRFCSVGSIQRSDDLTLSLELVDTETLDAIWSQSYDRKMSELVTLQSEIARNVSDKLRLKLSTSEQEKVAKVKYDQVPKPNNSI